MNILIINKGDWSGAGFALMKAINEETDNEAMAISFTQPGSYTKYPYDIIDPTFEEIAEYCNWADVINVHDSAEDIIPINIDSKPIIETYHGSWYRQDPERLNKLASFRKRIQTCLTEDLSMYSPLWIGRPIWDLPNLSRSDDKFTIVHAPTSRKLKGTDFIIEELLGIEEIDERIEFKLVENVSNEECLSEISNCSLLIDQITNENLPGAGTVSLEAWASGVPVVSHCGKAPYARIEEIVGDGKVPFASPNEGGIVKKGELRNLVLKLASDIDLYNEYVSRGRKYIDEYHSPKVVSSLFIAECERAIAEFKQFVSNVPISVCMIAKNETGVINKAISSIRGVTKDVVVVDTGSEDNTVSLCKSMGCRVLTGADAMNKAESRNKAISAAKGEWIVILDADEIVTDPIGLSSGITLLAGSGVAGGSINAGCSMGFGGVPTEVFHQMRVWEKDAYRYKYRAHELPTLQKGANDKTAVVDVLFAHYPNRSYKHNAWKLQYTLDRLLLDVKDDPDAARPRYYLGRQHVYMGEYDKAIIELGKFLEMTKVVGHWDRPNACLDTYKAYIEKSNLEEDNTKKQALLKESVKWLYNACLENPTNRKWWLELAIRYYDLGKFNLVVGLLSLMYSLPVADQWGYRSTTCDGDVPLDLMARAFWKLKDYESGRACAKKALELRPEDKRLEENLRFFTDKLALIEKEALDKESKIVYN